MAAFLIRKASLNKCIAELSKRDHPERGNTRLSIDHINCTLGHRSSTVVKAVYSTTVDLFHVTSARQTLSTRDAYGDPPQATPLMMTAVTGRLRPPSQPGDCRARIHSTLRNSNALPPPKGPPFNRRPRESKRALVDFDERST